MEAEFWHERWRQNEIGFHQDTVNPWLEHLIEGRRKDNDPACPPRVFVPLCGKSRDMLWLADNGFDVVGVEVSQIAVEDFFRESALQPAVEQVAGHTHYVTDNIRLICGDYFALESEETGLITDVFDRASLIALPTEMRRRYTMKMAALLTPGSTMLLVTLDYPQHEMDGPPFAVGQAEIEQLYGAAFDTEVLDSRDLLDEEQRFRERGLTRLTETAYKLTKTRES